MEFPRHRLGILQQIQTDRILELVKSQNDY